MRFLEKIGRALQAIGRLLGISAREPGCADPVAKPATSIQVPAVAGFAKRLPVDRFLLAGRLASIAKLNTPLGRKPRIASRRPAHLPLVPVARLGARKTRLEANRGLRVLALSLQQLRPTAEVIPFPSAQTLGDETAASMAKAA